MGRKAWERIYIVIIIGSGLMTFAFPLAAVLFCGTLVLILLLSWRSDRRCRRIYRSLRKHLALSCALDEALNIRYRVVIGKSDERSPDTSEMIGVLVPTAIGLQAFLVSEFDGTKKVVQLLPSRDVIDARSLSKKQGGVGWLRVGPPDGFEHQFASESGKSESQSKDATRALGYLLQKYLHLDRCLQCDYELAGNATGVCSECGTPFFRPNEQQVPSGEFDSVDSK